MSSTEWIKNELTAAVETGQYVNENYLVFIVMSFLALIFSESVEAMLSSRRFPPHGEKKTF